MNEQHASPRIAAVADMLATELEFTVPTGFDGPDGWYFVAERALAAGDVAAAGETQH